jgi:hypothetical protein
MYLTKQLLGGGGGAFGPIRMVALDVRGIKKKFHDRTADQTHLFLDSWPEIAIIRRGENTKNILGIQ